MPWSPTRELSHPLSNLKRGVNQPDDRTSNLTSYYLIDAMVWQGLGDIINRLRYKILGLDPITPTQAVGLTYELNIPHTYCWYVRAYNLPLHHLANGSAPRLTHRLE